jgi:hypothetical protein
MSTGGDPAGRPTGDAEARPGATDERGRLRAGQQAGNALAYPLAGGAAAAVLCVIVLAAVNPSPGRHVRGLLVLLAVVGVLAVAWGWARTVWNGPEADREPAGPDHPRRAPDGRTGPDEPRVARPEERADPDDPRAGNAE